MNRNIYEVGRLRSTPIAHWVAAIARLPKAIQSEIACIIWWDQFSGMTAGKAPTDLNHHLTAKFTPSPKETVIDALVECGYGRFYANARIKR
jgi:hypothetical protein